MEIVFIGTLYYLFYLFISLIRSLLFSYLEEIINGLKSSEPICTKTRLEYQNFLDIIRKSKDELVSIGYDEFTFEIFYDVKIYIYIYIVSFRLFFLKIANLYLLFLDFC